MAKYGLLPKEKADGGDYLYGEAQKVGSARHIYSPNVFSLSHVGMWTIVLQVVHYKLNDLAITTAFFVGILIFWKGKALVVYFIKKIKTLLRKPEGRGRQSYFWWKVLKGLSHEN